MNLIKKIKNIFTKKKNIETLDWNDYHSNYWFPNSYSQTDVLGRMIKLNKIYKKDRYSYIAKISSSMIHYSSHVHSHPVRKTFTIPVGDTNLDKGFKSAIGKYSISGGYSNIAKYHAIGFNSMYLNCTGTNNTAYGYSAFTIPVNEIRIKKLTKIYRKES